MRLAIVLLRYVWLEVFRAGPLDLPQLMSERRTSYCIGQVISIPQRRPIRSRPSMPIRLVTRLLSPLDSGPGVFLEPLPKNLTLIATHSWVRRCRGHVITGVNPTGRPWWRGVHRGCGAFNPSTINARRLGGLAPRPEWGDLRWREEGE